MTFGTLDDELAIVLKSHGHYWGSVDYDNVGTWTRIDIVTFGALDCSFDIDENESSGHAAIVDCLFDYLSERDYLLDEQLCVDAYETNGEDYNERIYIREQN